jgi:hypothetical protein
MTFQTEKTTIMTTASSTPKNYDNRADKDALKITMIIDGPSIMIALLCSGVATAEVR